jgi:LDH2 family malate/lactate/ureidoglycolate dehydrogenase
MSVLLLTMQEKVVEEKKNISSEVLRSFSEGVFMAMGMPEKDAKLASDVLIAADLGGVDSHGVSRLSGYVGLWEAGRINPTPRINITREHKSVFNVDGDSGLGLVIAPKVMQMAIERTEEFGSGWATIHHSNHFGIAGYHARLALKRDFLGCAMTNATPFVSPARSTEKMLGTNPIAFAVPSNQAFDVVADLATSAVARGKLELARRAEKPIPEGWLQTKEGQSTTNPDDIYDEGALLPLGSDEQHGIHKGYALSAFVDMLTGVISGANYGPWVPPFVSFLPVLENSPGKGLGHFVGAMDLRGFDDIEAIKNRMDHWVQTFKSSTAIDPEKPVLIPGEPEYMSEQTRSKKGIPLNLKVVENLEGLAQKFNLVLG